MPRRHAPVLHFVALALSLGACSAPGAAGDSGPTAASAGATAASASPTALVSAACMDPEIRTLFLDNVGTLDTLSAEQLAAITGALKAYDFGTEQSRKWRDDTVAAIEAGRLDAQYHTLTAVMIAGGQIVIEACP
jgi:hypothetical protein